MPDDDDLLIGPDELGPLLLRLIADVQAMNLRIGALRELLHDHLGIADAQYAAALAKVSAGVRDLDRDGPKH
jgi:hypothetical protein